MKAILLNGPPGSGKDFLTKHMCDRYINFVPMKFATPLYKTVQEAFSLSEAQWSNLYSIAKEEPSDALMGLSPREAMIWMSEDVMKPKFGQDYYGKLAALHLKILSDQNPHTVGVFSDSGFPLEASVVANYIGGDNCLLVRLERDGCDFSGDSRTYWHPHQANIPTSNMITLSNSNVCIGELADILLMDVERLICPSVPC